MSLYVLSISFNVPSDAKSLALEDENQLIEPLNVITALLKLEGDSLYHSSVL